MVQTAMAAHPDPTPSVPQPDPPRIEQRSDPDTERRLEHAHERRHEHTHEHDGQPDGRGHDRRGADR